MSAWAEQKAFMRQTVHDSRKEPAVYTAPDGSFSVDVQVRLHQGNKLFGDLDREGYGKVVADCPRMVFDVAEVMPVWNATVLVESTGERFNIDVVRPPDGPVEVVCEVSVLDP